MSETPQAALVAYPTPFEPPPATTSSTSPLSRIGKTDVITVNRNKRNSGTTRGILEALGVVWDHWRASFHKANGFQEVVGTITEEYPEERRKLPETYRNMPILLFDDATGQELCTSCFQCERICPPQVIHITQQRDPETDKAIPAATEFVIEYDACMSCGFCAEVCPFDAIKMDHTFELATAQHPSLTVDKAGLLRPVSYYQSLAPKMWGEVAETAMKKLQTNMKRRPGLVGVAPQMVEKVKALQAAAAAAPPVVAEVPPPHLEG